MGLVAFCFAFSKFLIFMCMQTYHFEKVRIQGWYGEELNMRFVKNFLCLSLSLLSPLLVSGQSRALCQTVGLTDELRLTPAGEDYENGFMVRVCTEIGGSKRVFCVDSGATGHIVDRRLGEYLTHSIGSVTAETSNGEIEVTIHMAPSIEVNSRTIELGEVAMIDLSKLDSVFGFRLDGFLGAPLVIDYGLGFDFYRNYFYIGRASERKFESTHPLEITDSHQLYTSDIRIGHDKIRCLIDTGMNSPISITKEYYDELKHRGTLRELYPSQKLTGNGILSSRMGLLESVEVWGHRFIDVPIEEDTRQNKIGLELLTRFSFSINGTTKIIETNRHRQTDAPFLYDRSGLQIQFFDKKFVISRIRPDSPAMQANLNEGSCIIAVNDKVIDPNWKELFRLRELFCMNGPATLKLQVHESSVSRDVFLQW